MALKQIKVRTPDLDKGMYVSQLDRPWIETPYKLQGFLIRTQKDIDKLIQHTDYVYVDTERSESIPNDPAQSTRVLWRPGGIFGKHEIKIPFFGKKEEV